jgi:hypothetical protein
MFFLIYCLYKYCRSVIFSTTYLFMIVIYPPRGLIYYHSMYIAQATGVSFINTLHP